MASAKELHTRVTTAKFGAGVNVRTAAWYNASQSVEVTGTVVNMDLYKLHPSGPKKTTLCCHLKFALWQ